MTSNQITPAQSEASKFLGGLGYGFGGSVVTRREQIAWNISTCGWDGGMGSTWYIDPHEKLTMILLTNAAWDSPRPPAHFRDFWTLTYQAFAG
jgi:CubicO group peptidase (beta-lactamase class C family)